MANLVEQSTWEPGIYQLETTDPVVGGPNGTSNVQGKQLGNRTRYLKDKVDELQAIAKGIDAEAQNAIVAAIAQALSISGVNSLAIEHLRKRALAQGTVVLKNKWVISGMVLAKADIRALHLSATGTVGTGVSLAWSDGAVRTLVDDDYHVSVPTNPGATTKTYFAYLINEGGAYRVNVGETIPDTGLRLYELTIPAGDTANNLNAVTLTDRRTIQAYNGWVIGTVQDVYVPLPAPMPNAPDYAVDLMVESATDLGAVGQLEIEERQQNGFRIRIRGGADNVRVRWTLLNPAG
jgi:hypothetical protein